MKILFITHQFHPFIGGIEVNSEILANQFLLENHEIKMVTWTVDAEPRKKFPYDIIRKPNLMQLVKLHLWADVVFENNPCIRLAWPALAFFKKRVVAVCTWVRRMDDTMSIIDYIKLIWLKQASSVIAISEAIRLQANKNAFVIGNPYNNELFKDLKLNRAKDFVFLGRLVSDKGANHAIAAFQKLIRYQLINSPSAKPYTLTIIGDGPEMINLKEQVESYQLKSNIIFKGVLSGEELVSCLNEHSYMLIPSIWEEPFGNVALEGMACGCIPIVSDGGGLPDAVGDAGLVFKRGEIDALFNTMKDIIQNENLANKLKNNAKSHLINYYPEVIAKRYLEVLAKAV